MLGCGGERVVGEFHFLLSYLRTAKKEKEWDRDGKEGEGMDWRENDEEAEHMAAVITVSTV